MSHYQNAIYSSASPSCPFESYFSFLQCPQVSSSACVSFCGFHIDASLVVIVDIFALSSVVKVSTGLFTCYLQEQCQVIECPQSIQCPQASLHVNCRSSAKLQRSRGEGWTRQRIGFSSLRKRTGSSNDNLYKMLQVPKISGNLRKR